MQTFVLRSCSSKGPSSRDVENGARLFLASFWLALRTLIFFGFYMNHNKEVKSLTFWKGSEVSQVVVSLVECQSWITILD